jgi:hypothetical protein
MLIDATCDGGLRAVGDEKLHRDLLHAQDDAGGGHVLLHSCPRSNELGVGEHAVSA